MDANYGGGLLDMVKGGAGKFFSNFKDNLKDTLKDTSTKVMHQVATWVITTFIVYYIVAVEYMWIYDVQFKSNSGFNVRDLANFLQSPVCVH